MYLYITKHFTNTSVLSSKDKITKTENRKGGASIHSISYKSFTSIKSHH